MSNRIKHLYRFENFRVDPVERCLWRGNELVALTPKAFETLVVLLENNGRVVDKDTLLSEVWTDTFVEESTLAQNIFTLRRTLALQSDGRQFIETIPRRGYRFIGEVQEVLDSEEFWDIESPRRTNIVADKEIYESPVANNDLEIEKYGVQFAKKSFLHKHRWLVIGGALILLCLLSGIHLIFRQSLPVRQSPIEPFREVQISGLASVENLQKLALSPDGQYIALAVRKDGLHTLVVRETKNANSFEVLPPSPNEFLGVTFSPDSQFIYYVTRQPLDANGQLRIGVLYKIPATGGTRTEILKDIDSPAAISPDGTKYAFIRGIPSEKQSALMVFDCSAEQAKETKLTTRPMSKGFGIDGLAWSPDGRKIAAAAIGSPQMEIIIVDAENGTQNSVTSATRNWLGRPYWLSNDKLLTVASPGADSTEAGDEVLLVSLSEGAGRKVLGGINGIFGFGVTLNADTLLAVKLIQINGLPETAPKSNGLQSRELPSRIQSKSGQTIAVENQTTENEIILVRDKSAESQ